MRQLHRATARQLTQTWLASAFLRVVVISALLLQAAGVANADHAGSLLYPNPAGWAYAGSTAWVAGVESHGISKAVDGVTSATANPPSGCGADCSGANTAYIANASGSCSGTCGFSWRATTNSAPLDIRAVRIVAWAAATVRIYAADNDAGTGRVEVATWSCACTTSGRYDSGTLTLDLPGALVGAVQYLAVENSGSLVNGYGLWEVEAYDHEAQSDPQSPSRLLAEFWELYWTYDGTNDDLDVLGFRLRDTSGEFTSCDVFVQKIGQADTAGRIEAVEGDVYAVQLDALAGVEYTKTDFPAAGLQGAGEYLFTCYDTTTSGYIWAQKAVWIGTVVADFAEQGESNPIIEGRESCPPFDPACAVRQLGDDLQRMVWQQTDELIIGFLDMLEAAFMPTEASVEAFDALRDEIEGREPFGTAIGTLALVTDIFESVDVVTTDTCPLSWSVPLPVIDMTAAVAIDLCDAAEAMGGGSTEYQALRSAAGVMVFVGFGWQIAQGLRARPALTA